MFGARANLMMALVVCVALTRGSFVGGAIGLLCGLITDVMGYGTFGVNSILMLYTGVCIGFFSFKFYRIRGIVAVIFSIFAVFTYNLIYYFFVYYIWGKGGMWFAITKIIIPECLYTAVIAVPLQKLIIAVNRHLDIKQER